MPNEVLGDRGAAGPFALRPQGGGTALADARVVFTTIVFVLTSGCAWRLLPPAFGVDFRTAHRRFGHWTDGGLWRRIHVAALDEFGARGEIDWSRAILDAASVRAKGGELTGPNPIDRGKPGSKLYLLSDANRLPLVVGITTVSTHNHARLGHVRPTARRHPSDPLPARTAPPPPRETARG